MWLLVWRVLIRNRSSDLLLCSLITSHNNTSKGRFILAAKLDFKEHLDWAIAIGLIAGLWFYLCVKFELAAWPAFIGWSIYFFDGADMRACKRNFPCIVAGSLFGALGVYVLGTVNPTPALGGVILAILAFFMCYIQTIPIFKVASSIFISGAIYFATDSLIDSLVITSVGLGLGLISSETVKAVGKFMSA